MNLFQLGKFTLNSGATSSWKIECDALTSADWVGLAAMVRQMIGPFSEVFGVPRGGIPLETALKPYCKPGGPVLIVDDVWTTGGSMKRYIANASLSSFVGAVVFARGPLPQWVKAVFAMPEEFWIKQRT